ncbi:MAG: hypothetical protein WC223_13490 [Bacteroidales bacterium]|jgi:hypothetical protein
MTAQKNTYFFEENLRVKYEPMHFLNELGNHLGNVCVVVSDKRLAVDDGTYAGGVKQNSTPDGIIDYYTADVQAFYDYYGGVGMVMPGRSWESTKYRFGAQGSEVDEEINGTRNTISTYFREGDLRKMQWDTPDPKTKDTPWESPYSFMSGNPVKNNDPLGDADGDPESGGTPSKFKLDDRGFATGTTSAQSSLRDPSIDLKKYEHLMNPYTPSQTFIGPADKPASSSSNAPATFAFMQTAKTPTSTTSKNSTALTWGGNLLSTGGVLFYSKQLGTWTGKDLLPRSLSWGGNAATGGKFSFARSISRPLSFAGNAIGFYNMYDVNKQWLNQRITTSEMIIEQVSNGISFIPTWGTAWSIGWNLGKEYGPSTWGK